MADDPDAAQQAAQQAANRRMIETILDLPKFYGTTKDTVTADNLIEHISQCSCLDSGYGI